jgi:hypothetical protein
MALTSNLKGIMDRKTQAAENPPGDWIRELRLGNDETVRFRFISDLDIEENDLSIVEADFHVTAEVSKNGKSYSRFTYCTKGEEDSEPCALCAMGREKAPLRTQILSYVYVYYILHSASGYANTAEDVRKTWKKVKDGSNNIWYKEEINYPYLLRRGVGQGRSWEQKMLNFRTRNNTLKDRDYDYSKTKTGPRQTDVMYDIIPCDASPMLAEVKASEILLPSLKDVATGKARSYITKTEKVATTEDEEIEEISTASEDDEDLEKIF